ncbi:MAG: zinc-binding dehydrogenase [Kiritimatiellales bacterium]
MKAAYKTPEGIITLKETVLRALRQDEVRLKVEACGICGTDQHMDPSATKEEQFGHEIAGTVLEIGSAVTKVKIGDRIVLDSATPCGFCAQCKDGRQELCTDIQSIWYVPSFGFAEEMIAPAISAVPNPIDDPAVASLSEPLGVAIDMHRLADIRLGDHVVVSGLGPIGLMALRLAKLSGAAKIYACDISKAKARLQAALDFGADEVIEVDRTPLADYPFEVAPNRFMVSSPPATLPPMFDVAAKGAIISYIGIKFGSDATISFDANNFHFKKLQLRASFASPAMYTPQAVELLRSGAVDGNRLITHRFPLEKINEAVACAKDSEQSIKVVVIP